MGFAIRLVTAPVVEPVSLTDAKARLRVTTSDEDTELANYIAAARDLAEAECGRVFIDTVFSLYLDEFPGGRGEILLPRSPVSAVAYVKYYDSAGVLQTIDTADYHTALYGPVVRVLPVWDTVWPTVQSGRPEAVEIRFTAGYGAAASAVPRAAVEAVKVILADRYQYPDGGSRGIPDAARRLLHSLETGEQW